MRRRCEVRIRGSIVASSRVYRQDSWSRTGRGTKVAGWLGKCLAVSSLFGDRHAEARIGLPRSRRITLGRGSFVECGPRAIGRGSDTVAILRPPVAARFDCSSFLFSRGQPEAMNVEPKPGRESGILMPALAVVNMTAKSQLSGIFLATYKTTSSITISDRSGRGRRRNLGSGSACQQVY